MIKDPDDNSYGRHYPGVACLYCLDETLKKDGSFFLEACKLFPEAIEYADETLKNDPKFIEAVKRVNPQVQLHVKDNQ